MLRNEHSLQRVAKLTPKSKVCKIRDVHKICDVNICSLFKETITVTAIFISMAIFQPEFADNFDMRISCHNYIFVLNFQIFFKANH